VRDVLGQVKAAHLFVVWEPMLDGDTRAAAALESSLYPDTRITHFWDAKKTLAASLGRRLGLGDRPAWDVYLLYDRRGKLDDPPAFWMHQLDGVTVGPRLDTAKLRERVEAMVR
jgi:hypothetical protein